MEWASSHSKEIEEQLAERRSVVVIDDPRDAELTYHQSLGMVRYLLHEARAEPCESLAPRPPP